jgi:hypothetical protein
MNTNIITQKAHQAVSKFCHEMAEQQHRGYAQAAWFEQNGKKQIQDRLSSEKFAEWIEKALELGYTEDEVVITPYISTSYRGVWYGWTSFHLEIPIYGNCPLSIDRIKFPSDGELPKAFIAPFLERERREAEEKARAVAEREATEKAERERKEQEKAAWIAEHGSNYLKRATTLGYDCQRQYVTERAALELPGYEVDFDNRAAWKSRSCPSMAALEEVERLIRQGHDAEVVWLTEPIQEPEYSDDDDYFEPCETIVVHNYLGKYDLVKEI